MIHYHLVLYSVQSSTHLAQLFSCWPASKAIPRPLEDIQPFPLEYLKGELLALLVVVPNIDKSVPCTSTNYSVLCKVCTVVYSTYSVNFPLFMLYCTNVLLVRHSIYSSCHASMLPDVLSCFQAFKLSCYHTAKKHLCHAVKLPCYCTAKRQ